MKTIQLTIPFSSGSGEITPVSSRTAAEWFALIRKIVAQTPEWRPKRK